jgi:hypothetical protein
VTAPRSSTPRSVSNVHPIRSGLWVQRADDRAELFYQWAAGKKSESDLPGKAGNWINVKDGESAVHLRGQGLWL